MAPIDLTAEQLPEHLALQPSTTPLSKLDYDPTLIQHDTYRRVAPRSIDSSPQPYATITPETKPLNEYESPLTPEIITQQFPDLVMLETGLKLYDEPMGTPAYESLRQKAKKEITQKMVHKIGVPSDYIRLLDIDREDTRDLLEGLYRSMVDTVDRENSLNGFSARTTELKEHIIATSDDPAIADRITTIDEHWIADLEERKKILSTSNKATSRDEVIARQRNEFIDRLVEESGGTQMLIGKIGNCLLHLTQSEIKDVLNQVSTMEAHDESARQRLQTLSLAITELHLALEPIST